ncbi:translational GTPase TypA [Fodinisporobacter ferrooxydans]|uniref:Large ribosomal subunit assembly factor BipA n=1 Tax=Fodinisporobacter ferrooxydans TaxID=2901836 RepID=A0ABY4CF68_9BACL|nr:translational GTPase TypA [Alicyclobacillaceae bacterium MYW30-H2]
MTHQELLRNIAIIAHVDHGKTTLVDKLLTQSGLFRANEHIEERAMDSNDLERERGITILAKNTAVPYGSYTINIVDTPGHADFGGEVERIIKMVDGVLLVVDAFEGCMPQTKFVLKKALEQNLTPIVVLNKIDRPNARPAEVVDEVLELFIELNATDEQLEFPVVYASALQGIASLSPTEFGNDMQPLFETIIQHIPHPSGEVEAPLQLQISMLDYSEYLGKIGIGRIHRGRVAVGDQVAIVKRDGAIEKTKVTKLFGFSGLNRHEIQSAEVGDIVAMAGIGDVLVGETINRPDHIDPLPLLTIDEPTLQMTFLVNDSPFAGREGTHVTSRKLRERLFKELETDVSLRVEETDSPDSFLVSGRGELHLSILIETMRREGYELQVSKPEVIFKTIEGQHMEPYEHLLVDVPEEYMGSVMERLGTRRGEMVNMAPTDGSNMRLEYIIPARGLIGFRTEFLTETRGYGIMHHSYHSYQAVKGDVSGRRAGVLIASETGTANSYGIMGLEDRGIMFVTPGTEVYEGMIVGEHNRENDLTVNPCKEKHVSNVRSATKDDTVRLKSARILSLEEALEYLDDDEYCEVTPKSTRLRKKFLKKSDRDKYQKQKALKS